MINDETILRMADTGMQGTLRLGVVEYLAPQRLPEIISKLRSTYRRLDLRLKIAQAKQRLESLATRQQSAIKRIENKGKSRLIPLTAALAQLSPLKILDRGYSIVETMEGHVVTDPAVIERNQLLNVRLAKGHLPVKAV